MAYRDEAGNYFQVDRAVDAIETPTGTGYSVFMEELLLNELPEVLDCAVVAGIHRGRTVPVAVVTSSAERPDAQRLLNEANEKLKAAGHPELTMLEVARSEEDFPVGVTGKVLKRRLREKYSSLSTYIRENSGKTLGTILNDVFV